MTIALAPPFVTDRWFNTPQPIALDQLRGKVVAMEAFQMLCPGCVAHGIPQAQRIHDTFSQEDVVVLGLHTVFEHHLGQNGLIVFFRPVVVQRPKSIVAPAAGAKMLKSNGG
jgi:hypothetical protein